MKVYKTIMHDDGYPHLYEQHEIPWTCNHINSLCHRDLKCEDCTMISQRHTFVHVGMLADSDVMIPHKEYCVNNFALILVQTSSGHGEITDDCTFCLDAETKTIINRINVIDSIIQE